MTHSIPDVIVDRIRDQMHRLYNAAGMARAARLCLENSASSEEVDVVAAGGVLEELEPVLDAITEALDPANLQREQAVQS